jgi:hypothetical protein
MCFRATLHKTSGYDLFYLGESQSVIDADKQGLVRASSNFYNTSRQ